MALLGPSVWVSLLNLRTLNQGKLKKIKNKKRLLPTSQREATLTCLVSFLSLQTLGRQSKGVRSNKGLCERAQSLPTAGLTNWWLQGVGETVGEIRKPADPAYDLHIQMPMQIYRAHRNTHVHGGHKSLHVFSLYRLPSLRLCRCHTCKSPHMYHKKPVWTQAEFVSSHKHRDSFGHK